MLNKVTLEKMALLLVWGMENNRKNNNGEFKPGDIVRVAYDPHTQAVKLAETVQRILITRGYNPFILANNTPQMSKNFYRLSNENQLTFQNPWAEMQMRETSGLIFIRAPLSLKYLKNIDPEKIRIANSSLENLAKIRKEKAAQGSYGWTLTTLPTKALAHATGMRIEEYEKEIIMACRLDKADPVREMQKTNEIKMRVKEWLDSLDIDTVHIESENTDLYVKIGAKRLWRVSSGSNIPSFEVFTSPDARFTRGRYFMNMPSYKGRLIENIGLEFKDGRVIEVMAKTESEKKFVESYLATDEGASRLGEVSMTDRRHSRISRFMADTLYDENVGRPNGNCHIALGSSFVDCYAGDRKKFSQDTTGKKYGFNKSSVHWDLVNTEKKRVTALLKGGGRIVIYENGIFTL